jgi:hypothetical protein
MIFGIGLLSEQFPPLGNVSFKHILAEWSKGKKKFEIFITS